MAVKEKVRPFVVGFCREFLPDCTFSVSARADNCFGLVGGYSGWRAWFEIKLNP